MVEWEESEPGIPPDANKRPPSAEFWVGVFICMVPISVSCQVNARFLFGFVESLFPERPTAGHECSSPTRKKPHSRPETQHIWFQSYRQHFHMLVGGVRVIFLMCTRPGCKCVLGGVFLEGGKEQLWGADVCFFFILYAPTQFINRLTQLGLVGCA